MMDEMMDEMMCGEDCDGNCEQCMLMGPCPSCTMREHRIAEIVLSRLGRSESIPTNEEIIRAFNITESLVDRVTKVHDARIEQASAVCAQGHGSNKLSDVEAMVERCQEGMGHTTNPRERAALQADINEGLSIIRELKRSLDRNGEWVGDIQLIMKQALQEESGDDIP